MTRFNGMRAANSILAAAALMIGTTAQAQKNDKDARQFEGLLDSKSPQNDSKPYHVRTMTLESGKRYAFSAKSENFDPALRISYADDNDEIIAENDDGEDGTDAYLEFIPARSGPYRVRISSVNGEKGTYRLITKDLPPLPELLRPSAKGSSTINFKHYAGALTASDGEIRGQRVDDYLFHFEGGKQVLIYMDRASDQLDPLLQVYAANDRNGAEPIARDDDSGQDRNAFLGFFPEESGDYIVRATALGDGLASGDYTLRVGQQP